ncbi:type I polyketide synthase [Burkholderia territorii]|uniref:type I polyketide synthase n=1 Tax=Burkholderia territorii TaxID=1503055 RepID=UPI000753C2DD|nr:type I polyketide synthase [Burkholderia territorii]KWE36536.1 beta-ketoacyl synthase [Burkholderia territorii]KWE39086.1 beta-ketoacyl synthase [Burkholderia territorii]KWE53878.1 beta-ketoacyl synthase [Burkholderia territorii]
MDRSATHSQQIAVIGMSCRFPGGVSSASSYWTLLNSGETAIRETPRERFDIDAFYSPDPDASGTTYSRVAGYVDDPFFFDRKFFRISAAEAIELDPQQRWMLELAWAALENAGMPPGRLRGKNVGVFMTTGEADYGRRSVWSGDNTRITTYSKLGNLRAMAPGRVAHVLGLNGPAIFVDTTCSSSLVAIHLAAQSLQAGECDLAIAGGVNLILGPEETIGVARLQAMSASGRCRPFDANADGYIRGEGGGAIVLKRLDDARAHGDRIDAVLAGSAVNSDGASNGLTAPNGAAQEAVIRRAMARAAVRPEAVSYVEAHGTGTALGDPIELSALRNVYARAVTRDKPVLVGSVKSQLGHLEGAAGMAGFIKAMLILRHRQVPAQVNFATPNPRFDWEGSQVEIPRASVALGDGETFVGVSGFGITGTNVHMILAAPDPSPAPSEAVERTRVLTLSGRSTDACRRAALAWRDWLADTSAPLRDACHTSNVRRDHFEQRVALVGKTKEDFVTALDAFLAESPTGQWHASESPAKPRVAFLVPGQGAWKPGVGAGLYRANGLFKKHADACLNRLERDSARDVLDAILGETAAEVRHHPGQLAHFIVCYALARTWMDLGVQPDLLIGHSLGEHVAAVIGGVMSLDDGLKAVTARGRLFDTDTPAGAMLAVAAGVDELVGQFPFGTDLFVAGINGPAQTVVSGTQAAVARVQDAMVAAGTRVSLLSTYDTPGHSPLLRTMREAFRRALEPLTLTPPSIPIVSTLTGEWATGAIAGVEHWLDLVEEPVRFHDALRAASDGNTLFVEVGPGAALSKLARAMANGDWHVAIASIADGPDGDEEEEATGFAHGCARLYGAGQTIAWQRLYGIAPKPVEAPGYAFDAERFELPFPDRAPAGSERSVTQHRSDIAANDGDRQAASRTGIDDDAARADVTHMLATLRTIAAEVAPDGITLDDDLPLVGQGFDSLALTELRVRLQQRVGKMPPISMLARGASLSTLAGWLGALRGTVPHDEAVSHDERNAPEPSDDRELVVTLREGTGPLVALVHPVGGNVLCYQALADAWPGDPTIVAIRHPYVEPGRAPEYLSIAQLASRYRAALLAARRRQPDCLGGWSFGGIVAHEMAAQWEAEGTAAPPLVIVDTPLHEGDFATRLRELVDGFGHEDAMRTIDAWLGDPRFDVMLDRDFHLADVRRRAQPATFDHIARLHAASAVAAAHHRPTRVRARIDYALAERGATGLSTAQAEQCLRVLTSGAITVSEFDDDHNSIVCEPAVARLARFLGGGADTSPVETKPDPYVTPA